MSVPSAPVFNLPDYAQQAPYFNHSSEAEPCLSEDEVKDAVMSYVAENCCYGEGAAREMKLRDIQNTPILLYTLDLFLEERKSEWVTEPYRGEYLDARAQYNTPVDAWSINVVPPIRFGNGHKVMEVPGTLSVVNCAQCSGIGSIQCGNCTGSTLVRCAPCLGMGSAEVRDAAGHSRQQACEACRGSGRVGCPLCKKKGLTSCTSCQGFRRVKNCQNLEIDWTTSFKDCATKHGNIKITKGMLEGLDGRLAAEELGSAPTNINSFNNFRSVLEGEVARFGTIPNVRVLDTRQRIYSFPGTEVVFNWKGRDEGFLVYGKENRVYFPDKYPQNCCCTFRCNIL